MSSSRFVRASKYRHVYGEPGKDSWTDLDLSPVTGDSTYISASALYWATPVRGGGGPVLVQSLATPNKVPASAPTVCGHTAAVTDTAWNPFNDSMLFTASQDTTIGVWLIPEGGLTEKLTVPLALLKGHSKPVSLLKPHPTANNVLASAGKEKVVKIWDVEKCSDKITLDGFDGFVQDLAWDHTGKLLATSAKDKMTRVHDPRAGTTVAEVQAHEGAKASKVLFLGDKDVLLTVGFTRQSKREFKGWDPRKLDAPLFHKEIDQSAGVLMPFYDADTSMLYLGGKGDGNIRFYEFVDEAPFVFALGEHRTSVSAKGLTVLPKRANNILGCEVMRFLKLTPRAVQPVGFIVPRKSDAFQDDVFPDTYAGVPSHSADAWFGGADAAPKTVSLDPAVNPSVASAAAAFKLAPVAKPAAASGAGGGGGAAPAAAAGSGSGKSASALEVELAAALDQIKALQLENARLKGELADKK